MNAAAVALAARAVLAGALVVAAILKLRNRASTREQTVALLGAGWGPLVARVLPYVEIAIAIALIAWWTPVPGIVAAVVIVAFMAVVLRAQARHLPCPCFGGAGTHVATGAAIVRNTVLLACAVLATGSPADASLGGAVLLTLVFGAVVAVAVWRAR